MFRIKICGVTSTKDAQVITLAGADAVGLNFYSGSKRYIDPAVAEKIVGVLPQRIARVGVFVNSDSAEVIQIADRLKLDWIQLHGDEPDEVLQQLPGRNVVRAFRLKDSDVQPVRDYLVKCESQQLYPAALLFDAARPDEFGGTGQALDWGAIAAVREEFRRVPLILAGGLTPFNVADAIGLVKPDAVDVASGIESKPGVKDLLLLRAFINSSKKAYTELGML